MLPIIIEMSTNIKIQRICLHCGNEFTARTTTTKYCSHKCNSSHYKQKVKGAKIEQSNTETQKKKTGSIDVVKAKEYLSVRDVSVLLGCSLRTAYRLVNNGTIKCINLAERMTRIKKSELDKVLEQPKPVKPAPSPTELSISDCYTLNEVQDKFRISQTGLQLLIKRHNISKIKRGRFAYVPKSIINRLLT